tara:strand:- start:1983 stop:2234 length:252 start_codon:yes stop_codon:yes gene_type:complete
MYLPNDILDIIFEYKKQLDFIPVIIEYKEKVHYYYSSQSFSQLSFDNHVVSYYKGQDKILCKIKNSNNNKNGIYFDSIISIIK